MDKDAIDEIIPAVLPAVPESGTARRLAGAALIVMSATALSRVFGYVREIAAAAFFGAGAEKSAFDVAFLVPSTVQILVAQAALSAAMIPVFAGLLEEGDREEAWRVARTIFTLMTLVLGCVVVLSIIFAPQIMPLFAPGYRNDPELMNSIVSMTRLLFPTVLLLAITGLVSSILNSYEHFTLPAVAPILWNLVILIFIVFGADRLGVDALAWGVLVGTLVQLVVQIPWLGGRGGSLGFSLSINNPHVRHVGALMLPVSISLGLINLNGVVDVQFASFLGEGGVAAMNYAFRLYQLPEAIFAIAVGTVLFPTLSKLAARHDKKRFRSMLTRGLRIIFFLLLPISGLLLVLAQPVVRLAYEHGLFNSDDTIRVSGALFYFTLGSAFSGGSALLTRAFFSLSRPWKPTMLAIANLAVNAFLNWLFIYPLGLGLKGIPFSTSVVSGLTFLALLLLMRRELGKVDGRVLLKSGIVIGVASAIAAASAYFSWYFLDNLLDRSLLAQLFSLGLAATEGAAVFMFIAWLTRMPEIDLIKNLRAR